MYSNECLLWMIRQYRKICSVNSSECGGNVILDIFISVTHILVLGTTVYHSARCATQITNNYWRLCHSVVCKGQYLNGVIYFIYSFYSFLVNKSITLYAFSTTMISYFSYLLSPSILFSIVNNVNGIDI